MSACAVTGFIRKWNVRSISSLYMVQCKLTLRMFSLDSRGKCKHFETKGTGSNYLHSAVSRSQTDVKSSQNVALTQQFKSHASFLNASNWTRTQDKRAAVCPSKNLPDFSYCRNLCIQHGDMSLLRLTKRALPACLPKLCSNNLPILFHVVQQQCAVSRSFHTSTCSLSEKPNQDSNQKASTSQLHSVEQLMKQQVIHLFM